MKSNNEVYKLKDGRTVQGSTDWERFDAMTDEEVTAAALSDPDAQPLTEEQLRKFHRPATGTFLDLVRAQIKDNKQSLTVRYDADIVAFFKSQGKGYQRLMNNVLRAYMESQRPASRA